MGLPSLYEVIAKIIWRVVGRVCDERPNAVVDTWENVFRWKSTKWWQPTQASGTKEDPCNHMKWKHKWRWHNRGCVWDKTAADWAGMEGWMRERSIMRS